MRYRIFILCYLLLFTCYLSVAQTAAELDALLSAETVTAAAAARFVIGSAGLLPANLSGTAAETAAYNMAADRGWIHKGNREERNVNSERHITLQETAFLIMNAFELKGGIMYRIFHNPRYAYRELIYKNIIQGRAYGSMTVSGERLLRIITRTEQQLGMRNE